MKNGKQKTNKYILAIGAHPDDIELGCGGSLAKLSDDGYKIKCLFLSSGECGGNPSEREKESYNACKILNIDKVIFGKFPDTNIQYNHDTINFLEGIIKDYTPHIIFIPSEKDTHQDHMNLSKACITAYRKLPRILSYETDSTITSFRPTLYIDIGKYYTKKRKALDCHKTQSKKMFMSYKSVLNLASYRGNQMNIPLAEAFETIRYLL